MPARNVCFFLLIVLVAPMVSCVDPVDSSSTVSQELGLPCDSDCDCPIENECNHAIGECQGIVKFSPMLDLPAAGATCQCPFGSAVLQPPYCVPVSGTCITDCDCGNGNRCASGVCTVSFSPVPQCGGCTNHCGAGEVCDGPCIYTGGDHGPIGGEQPNLPGANN
jgi:hypothetical protein